MVAVTALQWGATGTSGSTDATGVQVWTLVVAALAVVATVVAATLLRRTGKGTVDAAKQAVAASERSAEAAQASATAAHRSAAVAERTAALNAGAEMRQGLRSEFLEILTFLADLRQRSQHVGRQMTFAVASKGPESRAYEEEAIRAHKAMRQWFDAQLPRLQAVVWIVNEPELENGFDQLTSYANRISLPMSDYDYPEWVQVADLPPKVVSAVSELEAQLRSFREIAFRRMYPRTQGDA